METKTNVFVNKFGGTRIKYLVLSLFFVIVMMPQSASAQCAMCRAVLETGGDNAIAEGINNGIVYLMAVPYILVGGLIFFIYKKMKT